MNSIHDKKFSITMILKEKPTAIVPFTIFTQQLEKC